MDSSGLQLTPPPPPKVPGGPWTWSSDPSNSRGGSWIGQDGHSASWDVPGDHWDVDSGAGTRQRYDRWGTPLTPQQAHAYRGPKQNPLNFWQKGFATVDILSRASSSIFLLTYPSPIGCGQEEQCEGSSNNSSPAPGGGGGQEGTQLGGGLGFSLPGGNGPKGDEDEHDNPTPPAPPICIVDDNGNPKAGNAPNCYTR